jgi:TetR/AcrR family transcriptional repressor of mexJK operon
METVTRQAGKRAGRLASGSAIREAAAALFLEKGYLGTSMDDVAAAARVSKQTIYTHFANKEDLFADLVLANAGRVDEFIGALTGSLTSGGDLEAGLRLAARRYLRIVIRPEVLRLRRLVLGEAGRFPELAKTYYEQVPGRVYGAFADAFAALAADGRLRVPDPLIAAHHFAWLTLGLPLDRGMFALAETAFSEAELDEMADAGVRVFLAAYGA